MTVPGITIRSERTGDAQQLADMFDMPGICFGTLHVPYENKMVCDGVGSNPPGEAIRIVAVSDHEKIIGQAILVRYGRRRSHCGRIAVAVHDDFVRKGIGTLLIGTITESATNWLGLKRLELLAYVDNIAARKLFEKNGFYEEGVLRAFALRNGVYVDAVAMARITMGTA